KNLDKKSEVIEEYNIKELETKIFECSLMPVDVIGDTVYLDFLKKNKILNQINLGGIMFKNQNQYQERKC
ncbi:MAG TPA: hypothetical protein VJJ25_04830, partial [Nitrosopumilaceae archaeon]|nr:hypothetical protein [Nitrosopumilaceae archaeon]